MSVPVGRWLTPVPPKTLLTEALQTAWNLKLSGLDRQYCWLHRSFLLLRMAQLLPIYLFSAASTKNWNLALLDFVLTSSWGMNSYTNVAK